MASTAPLLTSSTTAAPLMAWGKIPERGSGTVRSCKVGLQDAVECLLQSAVDVEHDRVTDTRLRRLQRADHGAVDSDFDLLGTVVTAKILLVEGLDPGLANRRVGLVAGPRVGLDLVLRDRPDVAEHLGADAAPQWIRTLRHVEHRDARKLR